MPYRPIMTMWGLEVFPTLRREKRLLSGYASEVLAIHRPPTAGLQHGACKASELKEAARLC